MRKPITKAAARTPRTDRRVGVGGRLTRKQRRESLLETMADHLLVHGLSGSSLRALAAAADTSDRMLLYYFVDRDDLLSTLLEHVAARLFTLLASVDAGSRRSYGDLLSQLWKAARTPALRPYMLLFIELAAAAGRREEPQRAAAGRIAESFMTWVANRLEVADGDRNARATLLLATLDGLFLLHSAGHEDAARAAATISSAST